MAQENIRIRRALISVSDKSGLVEFARALTERGVELISTGGTAKMIREAGLDVKDVSDITGFPEMMDGRIKTLHPVVHGGLLAIRGNEEHEHAAREHNIAPIDLLVVNLYPFEETVAKGGDFDDCIENIDIGGPAMIRAASKNFAGVTVVTDAGQYQTVLKDMEANDGATTYDLRNSLAHQAFALTARYDGAISNYLGAILDNEVDNEEEKPDGLPRTFTMQFEKSQSMRYGENPHQLAAFYKSATGRGAGEAPEASISTARQLAGKELSYNNIADTDAALECVKQFNGGPACVIVKHANLVIENGAISNYLGAILDNEVDNEEEKPDGLPRTFTMQFEKSQSMRYGENPHQLAAFYKSATGRGAGEAPEASISTARQLAGKELSYNNIADTDAALECVKQFNGGPACVIVKHANPCGVACADDLKTAYDRAFSTDPESAFGGIIAFNQTLDGATAAEIIERQFVEVIIAPEISDEALEAAKKKKNIRILTCGQWPTEPAPRLDYKKVNGGLLVQEADLALQDKIEVVTERTPSDKEMEDLLFTWKIAKFVKSNAIVYGKDLMTIGVGAGQMSRVNSARIATIKAEHAGLDIKGSVVASDAFFPFADGLIAAAEAGATAVIQPGGSMRDKEVIEAANEMGLAMVMTGMRHFRH